MSLISIPGVSRMPRTEDRFAKHLDLSLAIAVTIMAGLGVLMIFSATRGSEGPANTFFLERQAVFVVGGVGVMALVASIDYRHMRDWSAHLFVLSLVALLLVLSPIGSESKGTQAWFEFGSFQVQPSEFAKVTLLVALAAYLTAQPTAVTTERLVRALAISAAPMLLITLQPDLGTVLVFAATGLGVLLVGGVRARHLVALALVAALGLGAVLTSEVLADYQRNRLAAFFDPSFDVQGAGYNQDQSEAAIGAGGLSGQGLFNGSQTQLSFVPEQQTDFIFTVVGEELGFAGAATVLVLYAFVAWRIWRAARTARDLFGTLVCAGVLAMLMFEVFQNIGMTMGVMPVTGIPLPFMSYGGSATIASFAAIGLVLNVGMRRFS